MLTPQEIRAKIESYVANGIDLDEFEDWIVQSTWNIHQFGDVEAQFLAQGVELRLSEHSSGHLAEAELKKELASLAQVRVEKRSNHAFAAHFEASNQSFMKPVTLGQAVTPWQPFEIRAEAGCV